MHHSSFWPESGVDMKGKRVAVIGTGSTGIQISQEAAKDASHVTVFQRTPNLCLPMRQRKLTKEEQDNAKSEYPELYKYRMTTFAGFGYDFVERNTFDDTEEERQKFYEEMWTEGKSSWSYELSATTSRVIMLTATRRIQILACNVQGHAVRQGSQRPSLQLLGQEDS